MKKYMFYSIAFLALLFITSCNKEVQETYKPLVFHSLTASNTSFEPGTSVNLYADVSGTNITYHWSYNSGTITGGGDNVVYSCDVSGTHKVLCTVIDQKGEIDSREITLTVL